MFDNIVIGIKEGLDPAPLLTLAKRAASPGAAFHLATFIRVGNQGDESQRLGFAESTLDGIGSTLRAEGYVVSSEVGPVNVAAAIDLVRLATRMKADLMVIGLAKRTRVGKALMGSDAQRVILSATCPVISTHLHQ